MAWKRAAGATIGFVVLAIFSAVLLWGCSTGPVRIGAVLPLTGSLAPYGKSIRRGIEVGVRNVNADGGISGRRLDVVVRDSASSPEKAAEAFRALVQKDGVQAVIGGCSSAEAQAMEPVARRLHRVLFSPSASSPRLGRAGGYFFRNWPSDDLEAATLADFAAYTLHATKVLAAAEANDYGRGMAEAFSRRFEQGDRSVTVVTFSDNGGDLAAVARRMAMTRGAQVLFLSGYGRTIVRLVEALKNAGESRPLLAASALGDSEILKSAADRIDGLIFPLPQFDPQSPQADVQVFVTAFQSRYHTLPGVYAAHAYDALQVLAAVMVKDGTGAGAIRKGLLELRDYVGVTGRATFDDSGGVARTFQLFVSRGGRAVPLSSVLDSILPGLQDRVARLRFGEK